MKKNKPVTIKDVAKQAGVSISTVSRVVNKSKPVTSEVRQRVEDVIKELGYKPNPLARSLVTKRSQLIGVIVPELSDTFTSEVVNGIEEIAKIYDYDIMLVNTHDEEGRMQAAVDALTGKQAEALIIAEAAISDEALEAAANTNTPTVFISKVLVNKDVYNVSTQNFKATRDMTDFLIEKGHKRISLLLTNNHIHDIADSRLNGYKESLKNHGIDYDSSLVKYSNSTYDGGYSATKEILSQDIKPDAIFATSDEAAIGAINACFDLGYNVPEDISVAGFYDIKMAKICRPKLTTVFQSIYDLGAVASRMAIKLIDGETIEEKKVELPYRIVDRESVLDRNDK